MDASQLINTVFSLPEGHLSLAIIPTIVIPFAFLSFLLSAAAAFIAGLFGIKLKTEGPRRLLEVLLNRKVIIGALIFNAVAWGGYNAYLYWKHSPSPLFWIQIQNKNNTASNKIYEDVIDRKAIARHFLEVKDFKPIWHQKLPSGVFNSAIYSGGSIFAGTKNGFVYELNSQNGNIFRKFFIGTHVTPQPLIYKGHLYVGEGIHPTHSARIYRFRLSDGQFAGAFGTKGHTEGTPYIYQTDQEAVLLVTGGKDGVYGVDPETMKQIWHRNLVHADSGFIADDTTVYFSTGVEKGESYANPRFAYALNPLTGETVWKTQLSTSGWMPPAIYNDQVCFGLGEIYTRSNYGQLSCYLRKNGAATVSFNLSSPVTSLLDVYENKLALATQTGDVCLFDLKKKTKEFCTSTNRPKQRTWTFASPTILNKQSIAYPTSNNGIYILNHQGDIQLKWKPQNWKSLQSRIIINETGWYTTDYAGNVQKFWPLAIAGKISQGLMPSSTSMGK